MQRKEQAPYFIPRRSLRCAHCQVIFQPSQSLYSVLLEDEEKKVIRNDSCCSCWLTHKPQESLVYWQGKIPASNAVQTMIQETERCEKALFLLKEYSISSIDKQQEQAFILALYLERKKYIVLRKELKEKDTASFFYEVNSTGEMIVVPKMTVEQVNIVQAQQELADQLGVPV